MRRQPFSRYLAPGAVLATATLLAVTAWTAGCSRPDPAPFRVVESRWIEDDSPELLAASRLERAEERPLQVDFTAPAAPEGWDIGNRERTAEGLRLPREDQPLVGEVSLAAAEVHDLEVDLRGPRRGPVSVVLRWAAGDQPFSGRRSLRVRSGPGKRDRVVRLALHDHPRWRGRIDQLSLRVVASGEVVLREVRAGSARLETEKLAGYLDRPWKVDVGDDVRSALLTVPGLDVTRRFTVPEDAELRVAYGHLFGSLQPVELRILLDDGSGAVTLAREELQPSEMPTAAWRELTVELDRWAGKEVDLTLSTSTDEIGSAPLYGFPVWANPEVVAARAEQPRNVVLISIDTLRADRMSLYGHQRPTTPHLATWAEEKAVVFENAVAHAPWTLPSHTSMLTGLTTFRHGVNHARPVPDHLELLSETLRGAGYRTLAITGGGYLHPRYRLDQGFDRFRYWSGRDPRTGKRQNLDQELEKLLAEAREWIEEHARDRFFLFFHTYDVHHRVLPREPYFSRFSELEVPENFRLGETKWDPGFKKRRRFVLKEGREERSLPPELHSLPEDIYDSRIAYLDEHLRGLFDQLEALGLSEHTLVVLTSDHGEMLGEHGLYDHHYLYDQNLKVPLLVAAPWLPRKSPRIADQVRSVDIVPSILDLLGLPPPAETEGHSLRPLIEEGSDGSVRRPAWSYAARSNRGLSLRLDNRVKVTFDNSAWTPGHGNSELFDLRQDPEEETAREVSEEYEGLRRSLIEKYTEEVPALHVAFHNPTEEVFELVVEGSLTRTFMATKTVDMGCDCVRWLDKSVAVTVPPGEGFTLVFEEFAPTGRPVQLTPRPEGESWILPRGSSLEEPIHLGWSERRGWYRPDSDSEGEAVTVEIRWSGRAEALGDSAPEEGDEELRSQLEALGYL